MKDNEITINKLRNGKGDDHWEMLCISNDMLIILCKMVVVDGHRRQVRVTWEDVINFPDQYYVQKSYSYDGDKDQSRDTGLILVKNIDTMEKLKLLCDDVLVRGGKLL